MLQYINMEKVYNITDFADMIGKSVKTLQKWDRDGRLRAYRSPSNRRYYTHTQYLEYMGMTGPTSTRVNVIYARVSTKNQKDDLKNQLEFLRNYTTKNGIPISNVYTDYGSGLNYNRKNWNALIDDCFDGKIDSIIISHKDRFVRFGFDWIENLLQRLTNTKIIVVENVTTTPESELVQDLISIIHVFSCRVYGLRKYKKRISEDKSIDV